MFKHLWRIIIGLSLVLSACAAPPALSAVPDSPTPGPLLVTVPPNATPTPTPFQPGGFLNALESPTAPPLLPTATPLPTFTPVPQVTPTATIDFLATPIAMTALGANDSINFALLGSDSRGGKYFRTDTIVIAAVWPQRGQVSLISIPRDLWVNIPAVGMNRINTAYEFGEMYGYPGGGAQSLKDTLLYNLGIRVDHIAIVDFNGFRRIVDTLGGIEVPVYCAYTDWRLKSPDLNPELEGNWALYTAGPGLVRMDGDLALWYARSRKKSNDFDRGRRQQEVLRALYSQALKADVIRNLPQLYADFSETVKTDLTLNDLLALAPMSLHLSNADIRSYYLAAPLVQSWITPGGAYVLLPNTEAISAMLQSALQPSERAPEEEALVIEVQNGSRYDGWDALAAERLNYAGYATTFAPADNREHAVSLLYDFTPEQDLQRRAALLALLGMSESSVVSAPGWEYPANYVLVVGSDYQPCFDPKKLSP
ncbi:MAG: LCP family protein [Anaerolineales bacterium]